MNSESDIKIALMEQKLVTLESTLKSEREELKALAKKHDDMEKKFEKAETGGRLIIYAILGASAFLTQVQSIVKWIRNG